MRARAPIRPRAAGTTAPPTDRSSSAPCRTSSSPAPPSNRRNHREHDFSHRRFGSPGPSHRTACPGTPTARAPRPPCRSRAARVEPPTGRAPHARRGAPAPPHRSGRRRVHTRTSTVWSPSAPRSPDRMGGGITEPPRVDLVSMGNVRGGLGCTGRRRERTGRPPLRCRRRLREAWRPRPSSALGRRGRRATPSAGSASFRRSAMSSRLTRLQPGHLGEREPARLVARTADLVAELAAEHASRGTRRAWRTAASVPEWRFAAGTTMVSMPSSRSTDAS